MTTTTDFTFGTCQVCGTIVRCKEGLVARHGFKRIKGGDRKGRNTHGCVGGRQRPYENARDILPAVIDQCKSTLAVSKDLLAWYREPMNSAKASEGGFYIGDIEINECDLDRRHLDEDADKEEREQWYDDIYDAMWTVGIRDFSYGSMDWDTFWERLTKHHETEVLRAMANLQHFEERFAMWHQTISDEVWDHNRHEVMSPNRSRATRDAWKTRRGETADQGDVDVEQQHPPMELWQFGIAVARFTTAPKGSSVLECILNECGAYEIIDTHSDWDTVEKIFGADLKPA